MHASRPGRSRTWPLRGRSRSVRSFLRHLLLATLPGVVLARAFPEGLQVIGGAVVAFGLAARPGLLHLLDPRLAAGALPGGLDPIGDALTGFGGMVALTHARTSRNMPGWSPARGTEDGIGNEGSLSSRRGWVPITSAVVLTSRAGSGPNGLAAARS